jgi:hypothetical protein
MLSPIRCLTLSAVAITVMAASVSIAGLGGKYDTEGSWKVNFRGGGSATGTFEGNSRVGGKSIRLNSDTNSGCDLDGVAKLPKKVEQGKTKVARGKFVSDCGGAGTTKFMVKNGSGSLKENRKGDANGKLKIKGKGKGGFADRSSFTASARGVD